jgi:hypothetical protein
MKVDIMQDSDLKSKNVITLKNRFRNKPTKPKRILGNPTFPKNRHHGSRSTFGRFYCWTCGLSQGDDELCVRCPYKTHAVNEVTA